MGVGVLAEAADLNQVEEAHPRCARRTGDKSGSPFRSQGSTATLKLPSMFGAWAGIGCSEAWKGRNISRVRKAGVDRR